MKKQIVILSLLSLVAIESNIQAMRTSPRLYEQAQAGLKAASTYYRQNPLAGRNVIGQQQIRRSASTFSGQNEPIQFTTDQVLERVSTEQLLESLTKRGVSAEQAAADIRKIQQEQARERLGLSKQPRKTYDPFIWTLGPVAAGVIFKRHYPERAQQLHEASRRATTEQTPYEWEW